MVMVPTDLGSDAATPTGSPPTGSFYYSHQAINFTSAGEWYYVRINGVLAPSIAGRYFFKMCSGLLFTNVAKKWIIPVREGKSRSISPYRIAVHKFIPTENWPVLLVKGEVDPGIITGTIRYAGYNQSLYSQPIKEAGKVYAKMTTRLDPYTGQQRPDLPTVDALATSTQQLKATMRWKV